MTPQGGATTGVPKSPRGRGPHPGVDIEEAPVSSLLLQVVRAHAFVGMAMLRRIGLTPPHEVVLLHLGEHGGGDGESPQSEIVRFLGRDRSTVTATLQAMERAGLVTRHPSEADARAMIVALTEKGRAALPAIRATWAELEELTVAGLSEGRRAALLDALATVRDTLAVARAALDAPAAGKGGTEDAESPRDPGARRDEAIIDSGLMPHPERSTDPDRPTHR